MSFLDFIGFVGMLFLLLVASRRKKQDDSLEEDTDGEEQAQRLQDFLRDIKQDVRESGKTKPVPVKKSVTPVQPKKPIAPKIETKWELPPQQPEYKVFVRKRESRGSRLLHGLKSPKEMIILQEIIGPPKGLQDCGSSSIKSR